MKKCVYLVLILCTVCFLIGCPKQQTDYTFGQVKYLSIGKSMGENSKNFRIQLDTNEWFIIKANDEILHTFTLNDYISITTYKRLGPEWYEIDTMNFLKNMGKKEKNEWLELRNSQ